MNKSPLRCAVEDWAQALGYWEEAEAAAAQGKPFREHEKLEGIVSAAEARVRDLLLPTVPDDAALAYHPSVAAILRYFRYAHLPSALHATSRPFQALALRMALQAPTNPETTTGLRKLLEAKDCAVRAAMYPG